MNVEHGLAENLQSQAWLSGASSIGRVGLAVHTYTLTIDLYKQVQIEAWQQQPNAPESRR